MRPRVPRMRLQAAAALAVCAAAIVVAAASAQAARAAGPTAQERQMAAVVHAWSTRLNAGDNAGIARLFTLPAILIQGPYEYRLKTRHQLAVWHSTLPCAGTILSITYRGRFATAVFRLSNRGKTTCDAPGALAAARFEIVKGKIASWVQVAVPAKAPSNGPVA